MSDCASGRRVAHSAPFQFSYFKAFMKSLFAYLLLISLFILPVFGVPSDIEKAFEKKFPEVVEPEWEKESNGSWEATFKRDGVEFRVDFDSDGNWVETEHDVTIDQLPPEVRSAIEIKYKAHEIRDIEAVDSPTHGKFYDVEFQQGAEKKDVMFSLEGKVLDPINPPTEGGFFQYWVNETKSDAELSKTGWALVAKTLFNFLTIFIYAYLIYYRRHHDHKMLFLLLAFNLFLFPIFLSSSLVTAGFGFTIFALLALVRLRSEAFDKAEIAYLLGAISLTFVNTMMPTLVEIPSAFIILLTAYIADKPSVWQDGYHKIEVDYRISEKERALDHEFLKRQIADEYLIEVSQISINRVLKNEIRLTVMYRDLSDKKREELSVIKDQERELAEEEKLRLEEEKQRLLLEAQKPGLQSP
jgi:hypothetical protein